MKPAVIPSALGRTIRRGVSWSFVLGISLALVLNAGAARGQESRAGTPPAKPGWALVFDDEFDGDTVNTTKWNLHDPWGRERNHELQAYVEDAFETKDGVLRIRAEKGKASYDGRERAFRSGMMTTYQKFSQQYGRFELRCRVPVGKGLWPACWLLPEPIGWPPEIDILEILGHDTKTAYFTHHWQQARGSYKSDGGKWSDQKDFGKEFHVVAVEWTPQEIRWEVDGKERFKSTKEIPRKPMYLLLNLAVGGDWPKSPDERTAFPAFFEIDYVRVYKREISFDRGFRDETMRVDFFHGGNAADEVVTLDRIYRQGTWAGSRAHLLDPFEVGRYVAMIVDVESGTTLFSKRFDSYFGEYRTTTQAGKGVMRTYHESILTPFPKGKVRFVVQARQRDQSHKTLIDSAIDPEAYTISREPLAEGVKVIEVHKSGDPHARVDVAVIAEGYTAVDEVKLRGDLERFTRTFFAQEPFAGAKDRFNVRGVWKPSQQSGCDEPSRGIWCNTAIGTSFDSLGSERYLLTEDNRALRDIAACVPYDAIYVMVNQPRYGGGGIYNLYCTFTSDNPSSDYVFLHEFGHTFAGLADEYYTSSTAYNDFYPKGVEPSEPNITALLDAASLKWKHLVAAGTAIPTPWDKERYDAKDVPYQKLREELNGRIASASRGQASKAEVARLKEEAERLAQAHAKEMDTFLAQGKTAPKVGAFEGAGYASKGLYRPALDCIMFSRGTKPFCPVCERAIRRVIDHYGE
ncbi:MAG: M64 family metallopeptidase [Isosphaeraceae bacterium]